MLPVEVDELTPAWLSEAMDSDVTSVAVLDRHSGTTGRAHLALTGDPRLPSTVFAKLAPFDAEQRKFVNLQGMGVIEARLYRDLAFDLPVRVPHAWFADFEGDGTGADDRYVMLLEDLTATGCRFPTRADADIEARIFDIVDQLARLTDCQPASSSSQSSTRAGRMTYSRSSGKESARWCTATRTSATCSSTRSRAIAPASSIGR